jgi:hypothetical protein
MRGLVNVIVYIDDRFMQNTKNNWKNYSADWETQALKLISANVSLYQIM